MKRNNSMKLLSVFLVLAMAVSMFSIFAVSATGAASSAEPQVTYGTAWDGTTTDTDWESSGDTYTISSAAELAGLAAQVNAGETYAGKTFKITANIDLGDNEWTVIGTPAKAGNDPSTDIPAKPFCGTLVGALNGTEGTMVYIKGLKISANTQDCLGLVAVQKAGGMSDITLVNPSITTGTDTTGFFVGLNDFVVNSVTDQDNFSIEKGANYTNLKVVGGTMTVTAVSKYKGGIVGKTVAESTFDNCDADWGIVSTVTPMNTEIVTIYDAVSYVGGVAGFVAGACTIVDCDTVMTINKDTTATAFCKVAGIAEGGSNNVAYALNDTDNVNLVADTVAKVTNCTADVDFNCLNGGYELLLSAVWGYRTTSGHYEIDGCSATGSIRVYGESRNANGSQVATGLSGLVGTSGVEGDKVTNCASDVDIYVEADTLDAVRSVGGIFAFVKDKGVATMENCYYGGKIHVAQGRRIAGMVGYLQGSLTVKNCQFDGIVNANSSQNGVFIGRYNAQTDVTNLNMENCLVSGVAASSYANVRFAWIGLIAMPDVTWEMSFTNCYASFPMSLTGRNEHVAATPQTGTVTVNGVTEGPTVAQSNSQWIKHKSTIVPTDHSTMTGFDFTDTWVTEAGYAHPLLKVAVDKNVANDEYLAADLTWFNPEVSMFDIDTDAKLLGLAKLSHLDVVTASYLMTVKDNVMTKTPDLSLFGEAWLESREAMPVQAIVMLGTKFQVKTGTTVESDKATIRLVSSLGEVNERKYDLLGFKVTVDGTELTNAPTTDVVYTSVLGGGTTYDASVIKEDSLYLFVGDIEIAKADFDKTISVQAYYKLKNGTVVYGIAVTGTVAQIIEACNAATAQ